MRLRFVDWIWRVRGSVPVDATRPAAAIFGSLDNLLLVGDTTRRVVGDTLTFTKKNQLPQDRMAAFDGGTLRVADGTLRYDLMSRALLACFLAPLLFFALGHAGVAFDTWRNPPDVVKAKEKAEERRSKVKAENVPMNPIDKFLGAPRPEKKKKGGDKIGKRNRKPSMTTAYVFMGIFFALWAIGRVLEQKLIHARLRATLMQAESADQLLPEPASATPPRPRAAEPQRRQRFASRSARADQP